MEEEDTRQERTKIKRKAAFLEEEEVGNVVEKEAVGMVLEKEEKEVGKVVLEEEEEVGNVVEKEKKEVGKVLEKEVGTVVLEEEDGCCLCLCRVFMISLSLISRRVAMTVPK